MTQQNYKQMLMHYHQEFLHEFSNWQHHKYFADKYEKELKELEINSSSWDALDEIEYNSLPAEIDREKSLCIEIRKHMETIQSYCQTLMQLLPPDEVLDESDQEEKPKYKAPTHEKAKPNWESEEESTSDSTSESNLESELERIHIRQVMDAIHKFIHH